MHVWQLLARALPPDSDIPNRLHHAVLARFEEHGWTLDNVSDPARVLRLPGTANYKSPNKPREVEVVSENVAYLIAEDVFGNLPAVPTPVVTAGEVGPLRLDAEAQPPAKLKELRKVDGGLARLWKQTAKIRRGGLIDPKVPVSPSEWDMALAHKLVALEFSDQEIVDTLIAYRREKFGDLKLRQSYYALTIGKARAASGKPAPPSSPAPVSTPALTPAPAPAPAPAQAAKRPKRTKKAQEPAATPDAPKAAEPVVVQPAPAQEAAAAEEGAAPDAAATAAIQTLQAIERAVRSSGKLRAPTEGERGIIRESLAELLGAQVLRVVCRRYEPAEYALEIELEEGPYTVTIGPVSALLTPMKVVAALVPHTRFVPPVLRATAWRSVASLLVGIAEDEAQGVTRSIQDQIEAVIEDYVGDLPYDSPCLKSDRKGAFRVDGVAYVRLPGVVDFARSMGVTVTWRDVAAALKAIDSHDTRVWVVRSWGPEDRQHSERYQVRAWRLPKQFDRKKEGGS
ncbi:MAG: hypothetical protein EKK62_09655 [Acidimicrobiia bacterium]|nr:MAG: hypothetical protein EKK62_09655 [Acidimicrobiia bacterium]